ncbi:MAG: hypothetical protein QME66_13435, partial [Candidatus Eisenbacteria bacterium]|nr:hypothetical protein [Candidatus Eisenbacteria bacterium]
MKRINLETLKSLSACKEAILIAARHSAMLDDGVSPSEFLCGIERGDWLIWWLWNSGQATIEQVVLLGCVAGRRSLRFVREQDETVLKAVFDAAEAVADENNEQTRLASSAARSAAWSAAWSAASAAWAA